MIRPASTKDSYNIASIMRSGVSEQIRRITIIGSPVLHHHIEHQIQSDSTDQYLVGTEGGRVIGMASWRHDREVLMLNHLYILPRFRGEGVGTSLMLEGLRRFRRDNERCVALDVFAENVRARSWYRSVGMQSVYERIWVETPLVAVGTRQQHGWTISKLAQANSDHILYGFSKFTIETEKIYEIGRLGDSLFRCHTFEILEDLCALSALAILDNHRSLLCIGKPEDLLRERVGKVTVVAHTERLIAPIDELVDRLTRNRRTDVNGSLPA
jgi:ribosomal protein S18 acetylase RimI-like enzyme